MKQHTKAGAGPSEEAVEAAKAHRLYSADGRTEAILTAAYALDEPRIVAEAEQAMVARIVAWFDAGVKSACEANDADEADRLSRLAHAIKAKFGGDDHA